MLSEPPSQAAATPPERQRGMSAAEAIDNLKAPLSALQRAMLRKFVPWARVAVGQRERTKSMAIKMGDHLKGAYRRLAELMVAEGRLPEEDLIYFFTHRELGRLLDTRSGSMINKAVRRRQVLKKQMGLHFDEICVGHPFSLEEQEERRAAAGGSGDEGGRSMAVDGTPSSPDGATAAVLLKGMPVSRGVVRGLARVAKSVADADDIQSGEVLVCCYTDIGWSPYFPLISGLATELGGLLSHGAVIAREYGLPCVVSVKRATDIIHTGDEVILDGNQGTLQRVAAATAATQHI